MQPSSLIFVVVIGIWAAFLVQYWVRRREHLATARAIDRFSEAMRVLDRRSRAARMSAEAGSRSGESGAAAPEHAAEPAVAASPSGLLSSRRSLLVARGAGGDVEGFRPSAPVSGGATLRAARRGPSPAARRVRALGLLVALAVVPIIVVAAASGLAPWWTIAVAFAELALCVLALRIAAVRGQTARHTDRSPRVSSHDRFARPRAAADAGPPVVAPQVVAPLVHGAERPAEPRPSAGGEPAPPAYRPGDPTWRPVPVPRPTYQLKDPAPPVRRARSSSAPFDGQEAATSTVRSEATRRVGNG